VRQLLLCLVTVGTSCLGHKGLLLGRKPRGDEHTYTSAVDDLSNPEIFVVPKGEQAMPIYVIHYK